MKRREKYHDVAAKVNVTCADSVREEVLELFSSAYKNYNASLLKRAFSDVKHMFCGLYPGYSYCDTSYHDMQHTLDVSLATARLIIGSQKSKTATRITPDQATLAIICALFHDSGYILTHSEHKKYRGAEFTKVHISRGAKFLATYLPQLGLGDKTTTAAKLIHYTGYEIALSTLKFNTEAYQLLAYILGTADLIAQMADRCYLEKCRDRLFEEFVLGGTNKNIENNREVLVYKSAEDLLRKTPKFYHSVVVRKLKHTFNNVQYYEKYIFGSSLYLTEITKNIDYLEKVISCNDFSLLRRQPLPNFATDASLLPQSLVAANVAN